jgi:hypothetical protein
MERSPEQAAGFVDRRRGLHDWAHHEINSIRRLGVDHEARCGHGNFTRALVVQWAKTWEMTGVITALNSLDQDWGWLPPGLCFDENNIGNLLRLECKPGQ